MRKQGEEKKAHIEPHYKMLNERRKGRGKVRGWREFLQCVGQERQKERKVLAGTTIPNGYEALGRIVRNSLSVEKTGWIPRE